MIPAVVLGLVLQLPAVRAVSQATSGPGALQAPSGYVPQRVYDTRAHGFADFETMLADLARADVVIVGEQHDDPNTHRLELAVLEGLVRRRVPLVISLEMFERDVQPSLDGYLTGSMSEAQFLAASRPWPRYATDYRPLIEFARAHGIPMLASDVPRRIANDVSRSGASVVDALGTDRGLAARELQCPMRGDYYDRFRQAMGGHPAAGGASAPRGDPAAPASAPDPPGRDPAAAADRNDRFYLAQCLKDETMGESIADAWHKSIARRATVVHVNGAFHSDYAEGTAASVARRLPGRRIALVSILPVADLDAPTPDADDLKRGDYLLYTAKSVSGDGPAFLQSRTSSPR